MTESAGAVVADVPETTDLGRVGTRSHIQVGDVGSIDGNTGGVPGVDIATERAGLPAERTGTILDEPGGNGRADRAASASSTRSSCDRGVRGGRCGIGAGRG